jgi:starch synthase (maltosyl-transferring)
VRAQRPLESMPRIAVPEVRPHLAYGRYAVKRVAGEPLVVTADVLKGGHDILAAEVRYRRRGEREWRSAPMSYVRERDEFAAELSLDELGVWEYTVAAWTDVYATWLDEVERKHAAGRDLSSELLEGQALLREAAAAAPPGAAERLLAAAEDIARAADQAKAVRLAADSELRRLASKYYPRHDLTLAEFILPVVVERERARFGAWYEMFPRSAADDVRRHGTFRDVEERHLPRIRDMGFDVLYFPPIHPIGRTNRKGRNNALIAAPGDPGSPWAIGNEHGGHDAIEPQLGTFEDFARLLRAAESMGIEIALDLAFQCSPDHPYVREHPEWFRRRPDGTIKYAENPPKKYEDIVPLDFWCPNYPALWDELKRVVLFWVERGVRIFRVDNPHTKPLPFWEWLIGEVRALHPDVIFLSEAFTRPKLLQELAKIGFSQSYTYFTWRNTRAELEEYLTELTTTDQAEYLRPNFFANTPDILHEYLQTGGRPAFKVRAALAATLSPSYGIYSGYELCENVPLHPGSEEYLDSEKYELKARDWNQPGNIAGYLAQLNRIRRENPALRLYRNLRFHNPDNPNIIAYSKATPDLGNRILVVANLDPFLTHEATVWLDGAALGLHDESAYVVHDLITGARYQWSGRANYVRLDPNVEPVHLFRLEAP